MSKGINIWHWVYGGWYYWKHPWKWFQELWQNIVNAYDRITKGYCVMDWTDFDMWFKQLAPLMLRELANNGEATCKGEMFDTREKWESWLNKMADNIEECQDEDNGNEYYEPFVQMIMERHNENLNSEETPEETELRRKYHLRSLEVMKEHKELFESTMEELIKHWDCLWD